MHCTGCSASIYMSSALLHALLATSPEAHVSNIDQIKRDAMLQLHIAVLQRLLHVLQSHPTLNGTMQAVTKHAVPVTVPNLVPSLALRPHLKFFRQAVTEQFCSMSRLRS